MLDDDVGQIGDATGRVAERQPVVVHVHVLEGRGRHVAQRPDDTGGDGDLGRELDALDQVVAVDETGRGAECVEVGGVPALRARPVVISHKGDRLRVVYVIGQDVGRRAVERADHVCGVVHHAHASPDLPALLCPCPRAVAIHSPDVQVLPYGRAVGLQVWIIVVYREDDRRVLSAGFQKGLDQFFDRMRATARRDDDDEVSHPSPQPWRSSPLWLAWRRASPVRARAR